MDGFGAVLAGGLQNAVDSQVAFGGWRGTDVLRLVRHAHVQGRAIGIGEDGDGADPHLAQSAHHAHGNLAAIGNQDLAEHSQIVASVVGTVVEVSGGSLY